MINAEHITAGSMDNLRPEIAAETVELMAELSRKPLLQIPVGGRLSHGLFFAQARGTVHVESTGGFHTVRLARHPRMQTSRQL